MKSLKLCTDERSIPVGARGLTTGIRSRRTNRSPLSIPAAGRWAARFSSDREKRGRRALIHVPCFNFPEQAERLATVTPSTRVASLLAGLTFLSRRRRAARPGNVADTGVAAATRRIDRDRKREGWKQRRGGWRRDSELEREGYTRGEAGQARGRETSRWYDGRSKVKRAKGMM